MNRIPPNTLVYDRDCELCRWAQEILGRWARRGKIRFMSFQDPEFLERFPSLDRDDPRGLWPYGEPPRAMLFIDRRGDVREGVEAFRGMLPYLRGGNIIAVLFYLPGVPWLAVRLYEWIARNRYRLFGPSH